MPNYVLSLQLCPMHRFGLVKDLVFFGGGWPNYTIEPPGLPWARPRVAGARSGVTGARPGLTGACPGLTGARPGLTRTGPGVTGARPGLTGARHGVTGARPGLTGARGFPKWHKYKPHDMWLEWTTQGEGDANRGRNNFPCMLYVFSTTGVYKKPSRNNYNLSANMIVLVGNWICARPGSCIKSAV